MTVGLPLPLPAWCPDCERPLVRNSIGPVVAPPGYAVHEARGYCAQCYQRRRTTRTWDGPFTTNYHRNEHVIAEWQYFTENYGYNREQCARAMNMKRGTLDKAIERWKIRTRND